jgi:hypothetical protein
LNKLPKIFHNKINNNILNNKEYVFATEEVENGNNNSLEFINSLFSEDGFIFNKPLIIKTSSHVFDTAIVKKDNNYIYTLTDDIININDIVSIQRK